MDYLENGQKVVRIVLTGGPCSGKTSALNLVREELKDAGYQILVMPETATQLIGAGISPMVCRSMFTYQRWQMRLQMEKERIYAGVSEELSSLHKKPVLIVYDRGMLDNKAYVTDEEFEELIAELGVTEEEALSWYDIVFHLDTAAKGAVKSYTCANNSSRTETVEEAIARDDCSLHAWEEHPNRLIIDNSTDFEGKMQRLFSEMRKFLDSLA